MGDVGSTDCIAVVGTGVGVDIDIDVVGVEPPSVE